MNKTIFTLALVALTALSACKKDNVADTAPAAGDETTMSAPVDGAVAEPTVTTETTTTETTTTPTETTVAPDGTTTSTTTETTTTTEGVAVGEPNPTTPTCGDHADLVGKNVADIDTAALGENVRVLKPGDAATMDFNAQRINIKTDDAGVVTEVTCG